METSTQFICVRNVLLRYKCYVSLASYLNHSDREGLSTAFGICCSITETSLDRPVMTTTAHRSKLRELRAISYVDGLILPRSEQHRPLSPQQQSRLWTGEIALVYYSDKIGWGIETTASIPKDTLLLPYYGECIGSQEAKRRYLDNKMQKVPLVLLPVRRAAQSTGTSTVTLQSCCILLFVCEQRMNFILTIREHIPATADTSEGVLITNIDAARKGSVAR
jgi:hypothetical protein